VDIRVDYCLFSHYDTTCMFDLRKCSRSIDDNGCDQGIDQWSIVNV